MNQDKPWHLLVSATAVLIMFSAIAGCTTSEKGSQGAPLAYPCNTGNITFLTEELYPFSYTGPGNTVNGQSVEVVRELQRRLNCSSRIEVQPWNAAYETALHTPGTALFSIIRNKEREGLFEWVGPIGWFEYVLYARNGSAIQLESLEGAKGAGLIAVVEGDARYTYLAERNFTNIRIFATDDECLNALLNHSVSLWIGSPSTIPDTLRRHAVPEGTLVPVYSLTKNEIFIAFNNETAPATIRAYQDALEAMKADGTFARITGSAVPAAVSPEVAGDQRSLATNTLLPAFGSLVSSRIHGIAAAMQVLAITEEIEGADWDRIRPLLVRLEREYPEARFWYARPDGSYYTTVDNLTSATIRDRSYFPGVLAGDTSIGTVVVSKSTGRYTAIVAVPVFGEGQVNGVLGTSIYCDTLEEDLFRNVTLPYGYYAFAVDRNGMPVLDSLADRIFSLEGIPDAKDNVINSREGDITYRYDGTLHEAVYSTDDLTGWKVGIGWRV